MTDVIIGIRLARAVTAGGPGAAVPAVTGATQQALVTLPGGHGPPWAP